MSAVAPTPPGFRLERLELWNWGTFDGEVQILEPRGGWALLVGDNGSGKSTAIDALRTLLVPPRILNYNDASGDGRRAPARDRTRRSYVRGAWASSSTIDSTAPTTQYLRDAGALSAIAAVFADGRRDVSATVAQILWEQEEHVRELYACARGRRTLRDLIGTHTNTSEIRRAARAAGWQVEDSFAAYAERMRNLLCIPGDKALEVFNRAIGMKEVSDVDAFVRQFMLPSADTFIFIRDTVQPHYRTLLDCWAAIERAERQVALLRPVAEPAARIGEGEKRIDAWRRLQQFVEPYFARVHLELLRAHEGDLAATLATSEVALAEVAGSIKERRRERDDIMTAIAATDVGPRLQQIDSELKHAEEARKRAQQRRNEIEASAQLLNARSSLLDAVAFAAARPGWRARQQIEADAATKAEELRATRWHEQQLALAVRADRLEELESVERHRVNIPREFLALRARVAEAIGRTPESMPFAGELIEVNVAHVEWTGAIERLLRAFGLSLLVPEDLYRTAAEFINSTWLGLRLTFNRVPRQPPEPPTLSSERVPGRLDFRSDHPLHRWVAAEVVRRFNHRCCESVAELERVDYGITREGLVRNGTRHIKDDGRPVDDPGARILGWSIDRKIAALRRQIHEAEQRATREGRAAADAARSAEQARARADAARELASIEDFSEIDPARWSRQLIALKAEQQTLQESSREIRALRDRLDAIDRAIASGEDELARLNGTIAVAEADLEKTGQRADAREKQLARFTDYDHEAVEVGFREVTATLPLLTLDNSDQLCTLAIQRLQGRINNEQGRVNSAVEAMLTAMNGFVAQFPEFRQTLEPGRAYADSFLAALKRIEHEDLPRHRERFEHYLNENLVGDLLMLSRRLDEHQEAIEERIAEINSALRRIDYADDTYVQLRLVNRPSQEVSEFRRALRACFEHGIAPGPDERLIIFERVRRLLEGSSGTRTARSE